MKSDRKNGTYPVVFYVSAKADGQEIQQSFTLYVTIADEKKNDTVKKDSTSDVSVSNDGENSSDESEKPTSEPKLIITKCQSDPERLEAGKDFTLNVEIKNTSKIKYVQNMTIDVTCAETNLTLKADSNTFFFDRLGSNETLKLPLTFSASAGIQEGRYDIQLSMSYDNPDASSLSSSGTISVDIHQPLRVELEADELPDSINAGGYYEHQCAGTESGQRDHLQCPLRGGCTGIVNGHQCLYRKRRSRQCSKWYFENICRHEGVISRW